VEDTIGNAVAGTTVTLSASGSGNTFAPVSGTTNAGGVLRPELPVRIAIALVRRPCVAATGGRFLPDGCDGIDEAMVSDDCAMRASAPIASRGKRLSYLTVTAKVNVNVSVSVKMEVSWYAGCALPPPESAAGRQNWYRRSSFP
jgi:hypothetical protein